MTKTHIQMTAALASAALVLAVILTVSPHTTVIANEESGKVYGIDILGIANAKGAPEQKIAKH